MSKESVVHLDRVDPEISITLESKKHEYLARMVEFQLRQHFGRNNIWVIPEEQNKPPQGHSPCVRIIDSNERKASFNGAAFNLAKEIVPQIYGSEEVYVSTDDVTIMPEGDALKYVIDHLLSLQYGHRDYFVKFERVEGTSQVIIEINDMDYLLSTYTEEDDDGEVHLTTNGKDWDEPCARCGIPNDVVLFVFEYARNFRPDIEFTLSTCVNVVNEEPYFAPGYKLAP
jgi:hypothetical protein